MQYVPRWGIEVVRNVFEVQKWKFEVLNYEKVYIQRCTQYPVYHVYETVSKTQIKSNQQKQTYPWPLSALTRGLTTEIFDSDL